MRRLGGQVRAQLRKHRRGAGALLFVQLHHRFAVERQPSAQHFVSHHRQCPGIARRLRFAAQLFGSHIRQGSRDFRLAQFAGRRLRIAHRSDAEINQLDRLFALGSVLHHHVFGLQVAVDNPFLVRGGERQSDLANDVREAREIQFARRQVAFHHGAQRDAFDKLHHKKRLAVGHLAYVKHAYDAGVVNAHEGFDFLLEFFLQPRRMQRTLIRLEKHLDDDAAPMQLGVARQIDYANAAASEFAFDQVTILEQRAGVIGRRQRRRQARSRAELVNRVGGLGVFFCFHSCLCRATC